MSSPHSTTAPQAPALRMLFWETTARCNLRCAHCRRSDPGADDDLTLAEARAMFADAAALGRPVVVFSGGEPLLRDDWEELAAAARACGLPVALATNGTLIDDALAQRVAGAGFRRVAVSIDGPDAATHDALRGRRGAFDAAIAGLAALRKAGQPTQINTTVTRSNADKLDDVLTTARAAGAQAVHLFLLVPVGCGLELARTQQLSGEQFDRVLRWLVNRQVATAGGIELRATCAPQYGRIAARHGLPVRGGGCLSGRSVVFVGHAGRVQPCGYLPVTCGDVRRDDLATIWRRSCVLGDLRDPGRLGGACGACDYAAACGGCRARAFAATGDYLAAEPGCPYGRAPTDATNVDTSRGR
ncbi:MAG: radical SAM protein [Planctomycetota bacterium]